MDSKRQPDFFRVVRRVPAREYASTEGGWTTDLHEAVTFATESEARYGLLLSERVVPVYVKVVRKPKLHDFAWAMAQMQRHGKRVTYIGLGDGWYYEYRPKVGQYGSLWLVSPNSETRADGACEYKMGLKTWQLYEAP